MKICWGKAHLPLCSFTASNHLMTRPGCWSWRCLDLLPFTLDRVVCEELAVDIRLAAIEEFSAKNVNRIIDGADREVGSG